MRAAVRAASRWLRVPDAPPSLPFEDSAEIERFRPAPGYLRYMVTLRWLSVLGTALGLLVTSLFLWILGENPVLGGTLFVAGVISPAAGALLHLAAVVRFHTTWFALGRNSMRVRRGLWTITEATITFSNVQDVRVDQGPLERWFGFSSVRVHTAGGSSKSTGSTSNPGLRVLLSVLELASFFIPGGAGIGSVGVGGGGKTGSVPGKMEGVRDAAGVRERVMRRVRAARGAGLGDARADAHRRGVTTEHLGTLRDIRDLLRDGRVMGG